MSTAVGSHSGAGPLSLMSCVRESSPLEDFEPDIEKNVVSKRKFWNPKKWFRKKQKANDDIVVQDHRDVDGTRSRSTSELSVDEEPIRSHDVRNTSNMHPGLSVSHDSVFHPLNSGSSDLELDGAQSSSSLSISQPLGDAKLQTELSSRLRLRRGRGDTSEDDEGLPRSPLCGSPAAATDSFLILEKTAGKDLPTKSHSTCSDGSLLSMDSSEMDEDSLGLRSRHSSKISLHEKRTDPDSDLELEPSFSTTPLNHSAAHHRVSVRPKRTYGAPRRKKGQALTSALPATPEVNEDSSTRSISPEAISKDQITELYSTASTTAITYAASKSSLTETKLKSSSLPAGVTLPSSESFRLKRNKINSGRSQDDTALYEEEREEKLSLFERIFPRRSGKKKRKDEKIKEENLVVKNEEKTVQILPVTSVTTKSYKESSSITSTSYSHTKREETKPIPAPRTGAAARQRIQPIDIPENSKDIRDSPSIGLEKPLSPERSLGTSPMQAELENILKQRQLSQLSPNSPPQSPKSPKSSAVISKSEFTLYSTKSNYSRETRITSEDIRSKIKIAKLSPLQQRVLNLNDSDQSDDFKSVNEFSFKTNKPLAKSHSFKSREASVAEELKENRKSVLKASSLDSVKNLDELPDLKAPLNIEKEPAIDVIEIKQETIEPEVEPEVELRNNVPRTAVRKAKSVEQDVEIMPFGDTITISGPSHTAIVSVSSAVEDVTKSSQETEVVETKLVQKENQVSVTKIHLKHDTTHVTKTSVTVPEFFNKQLNKVEVRPSSNIILSMKSPKIAEEQPAARPKTFFNFQPNNLEIKKSWVQRSSENEDESEVSPKTPPYVVSKFKKNDAKSSSRKSSVTLESPTTEKPLEKNLSVSLESLRSNSVDKSSQDSLDKIDKKNVADSVVLRRKSLQKQKKEDEPELMKVFARRSLKLKDNEIEQVQEAIADQKQRDSDKENNSDAFGDIKNDEDNKKEDAAEVKQPLKNIVKNEPGVQLRKSLNNNIFFSQRAVSLNPPKVVTPEYNIKKQASLNDKRRTDHWISCKKENLDKGKEEITTEIDTEVKTTETTNNFSQRKAEWEKRAQQANK